MPDVPQPTGPLMPYRVPVQRHLPAAVVGQPEQCAEQNRDCSVDDGQDHEDAEYEADDEVIFDVHVLTLSLKSIVWRRHLSMRLARAKLLQQ